MNMLQELKKKVKKLEEEKSLLSQVARQALTLAMDGQQTRSQGMGGMGGDVKSGVSAAVFAAHKAEMENKLRELRQQVDNNEVVIGGTTFIDLEFCIQYGIDYFPNKCL